MKTSVTLTIAHVMLLVTSCKPDSPSPDVSSLADAIKYLAICGVISSAIWGVALVVREIIKNGKE